MKNHGNSDSSNFKKRLKEIDNELQQKFGKTLETPEDNPTKASVLFEYFVSAFNIS